ncbi:UNKNOWN [Stylonychia lemnae]|uniref:Uncharacterized protein n=1 Tax=Stylonychia lemnae TaxID=5949 RepID=A0A078AGT0_STYLE|nr:UNKNOWN [Stylonychia lemnae]|eukprot:CDW80063.1 UNKNOWN [Stylonychia lemnae]
MVAGPQPQSSIAIKNLEYQSMIQMKKSNLKQQVATETSRGILFGLADRQQYAF